MGACDSLWRVVPNQSMRMSHTLIRWVSGGAILGMAAFLGVALTQQVRSLRAPTVLTVPVSENADADIAGFVYRHTDAGEVRWEIKAQNARVDESQHHATLEDVQVRLFDAQGQTMALKAEEGTIDTVTSNFDLHNRHHGIEIEFANGYTVESPHIHWEDDEHAIRTHAPVTIHGHGLTITGVGLLGALTTETLTVLDDVRVRIAS